jgi:ribosomal-protein-alanine N-acetyltransferase
MISLLKIRQENLGFFQEDILTIEKSSFPSPWSLKAFKEEVRNPISRLRGVTVDGKLRGYICFWMVCDEIHLMNIAVHPAKRNKGLGSYLLREMIEFGTSRGVQKAWLEVRPSNFRARALYRKMGFKAIARRPRYYTDTNEDAIVMALILPSHGVSLESLETGPEPLQAR